MFRTAFETRLVVWLWLILCTTSLVCAVLDLGQSPKPAVGPLGVKLDWDAARWSGQGTRRLGRRNDNRQILFSSIIEFKENVDSITDKQLFQIASDALREMRNDGAQYGLVDERQPKVMSLLAQKNYISLASSQKGYLKLYDQWPKESAARQYLLQCQAAHKEETNQCKTHIFENSCGEIMATHLWYRLYEHRTLDKSTDLLRGGRIIAVEERGASVASKPPCGTTVSQRPIDEDGLSKTTGLTIIDGLGLQLVCHNGWLECDIRDYE
jgi:hypothetical protein